MLPNFQGKATSLKIDGVAELSSCVVGTEEFQLRNSIREQTNDFQITSTGQEYKEWTPESCRELRSSCIWGVANCYILHAATFNLFSSIFAPKTPLERVHEGNEGIPSGEYLSQLFLLSPCAKGVYNIEKRLYSKDSEQNWFHFAESRASYISKFLLLARFCIQ